MINFVILLAGLVGLWIGTELIVNGAITLAKRFHLKDAFIGFSILAIGTDLPEIAVMLDASIFRTASAESSNIILGSALGSAIGQISIVLGIVGLIGSALILRTDIVRYGGVLIAATLLLFVFAFDGLITQYEGAILIICYVGYFILLLKDRHHPNNRHHPNISEPLQAPKSTFTAWLMVVSGFILLLGSSELTVNAAISLAHAFGLSSSSVAVVIIGLGSSLPELSLSGMALWRKKAGLSIGNLLGSNILDTLLVPGIGAVLHPLYAEKDIIWFDMPALLFVTLFALYALVFSKKGMRKQQAVFLILAYGVYIGIRFGREML